MLLLPALCFAEDLDLSIPQEFNWKQIEADSKFPQTTSANRRSPAIIDIDIFEQFGKSMETPI